MDGIAWADLTVSDAEGLKDFYSDVVGGAVEAVDMGGYSDFNLCDASGRPAAGVCHARGGNAGLPPVWIVYFQVMDLDVSVKRVKDRGGAVLQGARRAGAARYAVVQDPQGAVFALAESRILSEEP